MTNSIAISLALTGARYSPWLKPNGKSKIQTPERDFYAQNMPITPEEVARDVEEGFREGALFFHAHARNPQTGAQYADLGWYKQTAALVRGINPQLVLSFPTSRKMEVGTRIDLELQALQKAQGKPPGLYDRAYYELKIRGIAVEAKPDTLTTFTVPEVKIFGKPKDLRGVEDVPGWNDPSVMQLYYQGLIQRTKELGVMQEIEITTMGQFDVLRQMAEAGTYHMDAPIHFVVLLGFSNGLPITRETYKEALRNIEDLRRGVNHPTCITVGAVIRPKESNGSFFEPLAEGQHDYYEVMEWVADDQRINVFRVGLEDTPELYGKQHTNPELVRHAVDFFDGRGRSVESDPIRLRTYFGCPVRTYENSSGAVDLDNQRSISPPLISVKDEYDKEHKSEVGQNIVKLNLSKRILEDAFKAAEKFNKKEDIKPGNIRYESLMKVAANVLKIKAKSGTHSLLVIDKEDGSYIVWLYRRGFKKKKDDSLIGYFTYTKTGKIKI